MEMPRRLLRLHLHKGLERRNGFRRAVGGDERPPQAKKCVGKAVIKRCRPRKMLDGVIPLLRLSGQFAHHVFRSGILRIDLQLLLKFFLGVLRHVVAGRRGEQHASQAVMNSRQARILLQDFSILARSLFPLALHLQRFRIQLVHLI